MPKLDQLLARNLGCSRAQARKLLAEHGELPTREIPGDALPFSIEVAGKPVQLYDDFHLMLNKPAGCVTALRDPRHATALSYLSRAPLHAELRPVGRLDLDTTGLLLWTTDGEVVHRLTHPKAAVPRTYQAALARSFDPLPANLVLRDGHRPNVVDLHALAEAEIHPSLARPQDAATYASVTIADGAYHEVRRIFAALGSHVVALCRVSFGSLDLPRDLAAGTWRPVDAEALRRRAATKA